MSDVKTTSREVTCVKRAKNPDGTEGRITHLGGHWGVNGVARCECIARVHEQLAKGIGYHVPDPAGGRGAYVEKDGDYVRTIKNGHVTDNLATIRARCTTACDCSVCSPPR